MQCHFIYFLFVASDIDYLIVMFVRLAKSIHRPFAMCSPSSRCFSEMKKFENNFLSTTNLAYIESLYERWLEDKSLVSPSFDAYFEELQKGGDPETSYIKPPSPGTTMELT